MWCRRPATIEATYSVIWGLTSTIQNVAMAYNDGKIRVGDAAVALADWNALWTDIDNYHHIAVTVPAVGEGTPVELWFDGMSQTAKNTNTHASFSAPKIGRFAGSTGQQNKWGVVADPMIYSFALSQPLIRWLADRTNKLYVPDTRKVFYAPTAPAGWKSWLIAPSAHIYGGGII
jgi:hypothetical protein